MTALPKAVNPAIPPASTSSNVPVRDTPQLGPYEPMSGSSIVPVVPVTKTEGSTPGQPMFTGGGGSGHSFAAGSEGAPSVPRDGFLFKQGPIDVHYVNPAETRNPYTRVNNPPTRGKWQRLQSFLNGIATSQDTDNAGWKERHPQQRTSVMRNALPPHGDGYSPETFVPRQLPQAVRYNKIQPAVGTDKYGTGVLNSDTFGAGQTAGGVGGSNYTPAPGPPVTNSITSPGDTTGMPTWG